MKLIYAGNNIQNKPYSSLLYNCIRNKACMPSYFVPVRAMSDVVLYIDLTSGVPDTVEIEVFNACNMSEDPGSAVATKYVVGKKPDATFYGVFGNLTVIPPEGTSYSKFFFKLTTTVGSTSSIYYSQMYEIPACDTLMMLTGCYPDEPVGSNATDVNGIYYGYPNAGPSLGDPTYRYYHNQYVREGWIHEQEIALQAVRFNSRKTYKATVTKTFLLEFELVPTFYMNVLLAIMSRGEVTADGTKYSLAEEQNWTMLNPDSKQWKMDTTFDGEFKQSFGCGESTCLPPLPTCCDPVINSAGVTFVDGANKITLNITLCTPTPSVGYMVYYRPKGSGEAYREAGPFTASPINIFDDEEPTLTEFEGYIYSDCGEGVLGNEVPFSITLLCKTYTVLNTSEADTIPVIFNDCDFVEQTFMLTPGSSTILCAIEGSIVPDISLTIAKLYDYCEPPLPCTKYTNEGEENAVITYVDCAGNAVDTEITPGGQFCASDLTGGDIGFLTPAGECDKPSVQIMIRRAATSDTICASAPIAVWIGEGYDAFQYPAALYMDELNTIPLAGTNFVALVSGPVGGFVGGIFGYSGGQIQSYTGDNC